MHTQTAMARGAGSTTPAPLRHQGGESRQRQQRQDQPRKADGVGVERRDDGDRDEVVDDRQREQENPKGGRQELADHGDHGHGERDVGGRGDRPAAQGIRTAGGVDHDEDESGNHHAADRGRDRQGGSTRIAQTPGDELLLQLETDDEEEDRQQAVGCPGADAEFEMQFRDAEREVAHGLVPGGGGTVGEDERGERRREQERPAEDVAAGVGADAVPQCMRGEGETGRGRIRGHGKDLTREKG